MPTTSQIAANQKNAQLSTGPTSETGKAKSSLNAVKTGLTGRTVLLPGDDAAFYEAHVAQYVKHFEPAEDEERNLVQSLADTEWRLQRIPALEMGIYALGRLEFAELFPKEPDDVRRRLIEAKVFLTYQRQLNNLSIQENRLRRQREKDAAALREIQEQRQRKTKARLDEAARQYIEAVNDDRQDDFDDPAKLGFEFTLAQIEVRAIDLQPDLFADWDPDADSEAA
ncbi:MAG TPA: hypothetical protein VLI55_15180 [Bryobacteraceae bacterium]|nr:hypothetical protein [Bryobacteraceae bacterium]